MADTPGPPNPEPGTASRTSVAAIVTYCLLGTWALMVFGLFTLVWFQVAIDSTQMALIGAVFGTEQTLLVAAVTFWVGSTQGAKALGDAMAQSAAKAQGVVAAVAASKPGVVAPEAEVDPFKIKEPGS